MKKLRVEEMNRMSIDEFRQSKKIPLIIVLDDIRSLYNVGSIFRTADAFRIYKIILCGITACPPSVEIHKTALGAEKSVEWIYYKDIFEAVKDLHNEKFKIVAIEQVENSTKLNEFKIEKNKKYAFILGNEVKGVKQEIVNICNECIEIPQYGTKHSLNVSCAASIVMWDFFRLFTEIK